VAFRTACPALSGAAEGICSERCRQLVMGSVSRLENGGPSRPGTADILSAPGTPDILLVLPAIGYNLKAELA